MIALPTPSDPPRLEVPPRLLAEGQVARIRVWDRATGAARTVHVSEDRLFEAPNWTPDGRLLVNADGLLWTLPVELRLVEGGVWGAPRTIVALHGGQGTINVPSWAPDSSAFAFVDYPVGE